MTYRKRYYLFIFFICILIFTGCKDKGSISENSGKRSSDSRHSISTSSDPKLIWVNEDLYPTKVSFVNNRLTQAQRDFLSANPELNIKWDNENDVPSFISGFDMPAGRDPVKASLRFLEEIKDIFRIKDVSSEFTLRTVQKDELGYEHVRFYQQYEGIPVSGSELIVHINDERRIYAVNGKYSPDIDISVTAQISKDEALEIGLMEFKEKSTLKVTDEPKLVVYPQGLNQYRLSYHYILSYNEGNGDVGRWVYYIDANTKEVINWYNDIKYFASPLYDLYYDKHTNTLRYFGAHPSLAPAEAPIPSIAEPTTNGSHVDIKGTNLTGEGGSIINVTGWYDSTNSAYYLYNKNLWWYIYNYAESGYTDNRTYAFRNTIDWSDTDPTEVSAGRNFYDTQNYFKTIHSRNSFDNASKYARGNVHYGTSEVNAFFDPSEDQFYFGDGDGEDANALATLDIVAHEYGHAWTQYSSNLTYQDESGALNESFSDIAGASVEFYAQPDGSAYYPNINAGTSDWLMGEDAWLSSTALRDMRDPTNTATVGPGNEQPSRYHGTYWYTGIGDNGGVHYNSGVQNFVFYLLTEGGNSSNDGLPYNVTGIGIYNASLIAYRANTYYLTSSSTYSSARNAWVQSATDLNSSWVDSVKAVWNAVGIIEVPSYVSEGFETEGLSSGWTTGGDASWTTPAILSRLLAIRVYGISSNQGSYSVKAGSIGHSQSTYIQRTVNFSNSGILSFFIRVSSERGCDYLEFYVDGLLQTKWSGEVPWTSYCIYLSGGSHTLKWVYTKDSSGSSGSDTAWIDAITWVPEAPSGLSATAVSSTQINLSWTDNSSGEAGFKIERKTGIGGSYAEIATVGANISSYSDTSVSTGTTYYYRVRAYNSSGDSAYSTEADATP